MIEQTLYNQILLNIPITCVDVCIRHNDSVLLVKRATEPAKDNWWFPGGRLYKNELLEACAIRKAKEETGLNCRIIKKIDTKETIFNTGPNNIPVHSINVIYLLEPTDKELNVKLDQYSLDYKWFDDITEEIKDEYVTSILYKVFPLDIEFSKEQLRIHSY